MTRLARSARGSPLLALVVLATLGQPGCTGSCAAASPVRQDQGQIGFRQALREAASDARVAVFAAHPDDEYLVMLALLRHRYGADAVAVLATRGEGGQNALGPELWRDLGALRSAETEESLRMLGSPGYFLNLPDTGYCRTAAEAIESWGREKAITAAAISLRRLRPDVVLTLHGPNAVHGHDLGLLEVLSAALPLAADPGQELEGLPPHRVQRAFCGAPKAAAKLELTTDELDPVRRRTYREVAYEALRCHRSQAPGPMEQEFEKSYLLAPFAVAPAAASDGILGGLRTLWDHAPALLEAARIARLQLNIQELRLELEQLPETETRVVAHAARLLNFLRALRSALPRRDQDLEARLDRRISALDSAVRQGSGIEVRVVALGGASVLLAPGNPLSFDIVVSNTSNRELTDFEVVPLLPTGVHLGESKLPVGPVTIAPLDRLVFRAQLVASEDVRPTVPARKYLYSSNALEPAIRLHCRGILRGAGLDWFAPVPCEIRSALELEFQERDAVMATGTNRCRVVLRVRKNQLGPLKVATQRVVPTGWLVEGWPDELTLDAEGETERLIPVELRSLESERVDTFTIRLGVVDGPDAVVAVHRIQLDLTRPVAVGIVRGPDDSALRILRMLGLPCRELTDEDLSRGEFSGLTTLLVDVRTFGFRPGARAATAQMLEFVTKGGRMVVLYHRPGEFNQDQIGVLPAPFALRLGTDRVTRPDAPVRLLQPDHPLLRTPHRIRGEDFDGWIHERALYLPASHAPEFTELLATGDPGLPGEQRGSLLYCDAGGGSYVFCSLALFRQLRVCRGGALRLFLNLITR